MNAGWDMGKIEYIDGLISMDHQTWLVLLRVSKCQSKKYRQQKKAVKKAMSRLIYKGLEVHDEHNESNNENKVLARLS